MPRLKSNPLIFDQESSYFYQIKQNKISWLNSFKTSLSQDKDSNFLPWITYPAINYLKQNLAKNHIIFEYGAGTSTLFYQDKIKYLITIESNKYWFNIINQKIINYYNIANCNNNSILAKFIPNKNLAKFDQIFIYPKGAIFLISNAQNNNLYQNFISDFDQIFDYIIIDSLKRYDCSINSINKIKENGTVILDDSQRKSYDKIYNLMANNNFTLQNFPGIAPGQLKAKNTSFFTKNEL